MPRNLICNFRAPDLVQYQKWQKYKQMCSDHGQDICHLTLTLVQNWIDAVEAIQSATTVVAPPYLINLQQQITHCYQVPKPRREPIELNCAKPAFQRTIRSSAYEAYVLEKARDLNREFSYRDYLELTHASFRRIVLNLKKKGKIVANPIRTNPRYYILTERLAEYSIDRKVSMRTIE